jgi:hypothetical protein
MKVAVVISAVNPSVVRLGIPTSTRFAATTLREFIDSVLAVRRRPRSRDRVRKPNPHLRDIYNGYEHYVESLEGTGERAASGR